jgi:hypothetical protein
MCAFVLRCVAAGMLMGPLPLALAQSCVEPPPGAIAWLPGERHADDLAGFHNGGLFNGASYVDAQVGEGFRFDGIDDGLSVHVLVSEQRAVRTAFSYEMWARPTAALGACAQSNSSNCSGAGLRWALMPLHGDVQAPAEEIGQGAGIGVAIGTDGVCVGEHAPFLVDCLARLDAPIADWTHVVVVVENRTPRIYLDGVLAHTGIASARQFVFASWNRFGNGDVLGRFQGELDEPTVYGRALSDEEIADLFLAGSSGKCRRACGEDDRDAWQGAEVTDTSGLASNTADGMFGSDSASPEPETTLFADDRPDGSAHTIEWTSASPVTLAGFRLHAAHDAPATPQRAFRQFRLEGRAIGGSFATLYDQPITVPYAVQSVELMRCVNLRPHLLQQFRATFVQDGAGAGSGPRVHELDAIGLPLEMFEDGYETP